MAEKKQCSTTHFEIAQYWSDKWITKDGHVLSDSELSQSMTERIAVFLDMGEPECWLCGKQIMPHSIPQYDDLLEAGDFKGIWNSRGVTSILNRCHIVPASLGGSNDPSNLFLLCERCHLLTPDYYVPNYFFRYIYGTARSGRFMLGIDIGEYLTEFAVLNPDEIAIDILQSGGVNWKSIEQEQTGKIGLHAGVAKSSIAAAAIDAAKSTEEYRIRTGDIIRKYATAYQ